MVVSAGRACGLGSLNPASTKIPIIGENYLKDYHLSKHPALENGCPQKVLPNIDMPNITFAIEIFKR
jgi:hypothetical protein